MKAGGRCGAGSAGARGAEAGGAFLRLLLNLELAGERLLAGGGAVVALGLLGFEGLHLFQGGMFGGGDAVDLGLALFGGLQAGGDGGGAFGAQALQVGLELGGALGGGGAFPFGLGLFGAEFGDFLSGFGGFLLGFQGREPACFLLGGGESLLFLFSFARDAGDRRVGGIAIAAARGVEGGDRRARERHEQAKGEAFHGERHRQRGGS